MGPTWGGVRNSGVHVEPCFMAANRRPLANYMKDTSDANPTLARTAESSQWAMSSCPGSQADLGLLAVEGARHP